MFNSTILEVAIGLFFLYLLFSLLATFINEFFSTVLKFRGNHLKRAINNMLDGNDLGKLFFDRFNDHPMIKSFKKNEIRYPSYIEPKKFAKVIIDLYENESFFDPTNEKIEDVLGKLSKNSYLGVLLLDYKNKYLEFTSELQDDIKKQKENLEKLKKSLEEDIESWFNSVMERTAGWFNRYIKAWTFCIALLIAALFNFDSINVYQRLAKDSNLRKDLVVYAEANLDHYAKFVPKETLKSEKDSLLFDQMDSLKNEIELFINEDVKSIENLAALGWSLPENKPEKNNPFWERFKFWSYFWFLKILGFLITAIAISLGAPFWFDILNKIMSLRGTGKKQDVIKQTN